MKPFMRTALWVRNLTEISLIEGRELVDWLYENFQFESRNIATQLAIHLVISGLIEGVPQGLFS